MARLRAYRIGLVALALVATGCSSSGDGSLEPVVIDDTRQVAPHPIPFDKSNGERFGSPVAGPDIVGSSAGASQFSYDLPQGWAIKAATEFRLVNLVTPGGAECTVGKSIGGSEGVQRNINRWRGQVGADALDPEAMATLPTAPLLGGEAVIVDATGPYTGMGTSIQVEDARLYGYVLQRGEEIVTVKCVGPADAVTAALPALEAFAASLREVTP